MATHPGDSITPGLQLHLVDSDDEPLDEGAGGTRRPSTASLSRFRSCPQLSSADTHTQESPGSDDHGLGPELCVSSVHFTQGSPRSRQHLHKDDTGGRSQTPTPPSTPGSRRSHTSIKDGATHQGGGAPRGGAGGETSTAVSRAVGRARLEHAFLGRTSSTDNPAFMHHEDNNLRSDDQSEGRVLSEFFDEPPEVSLDGRLTATEDGASTPLGGERGYHTDQDSMDKCARWLQSLKMSSGDRLKSRSHIQLPPI